MKLMKPTYNLIPLSNIETEARKIAVKWGDEYFDGIALSEKQKLASDIMNYASWRNEVLEAEVRSLEVQIDDINDELNSAQEDLRSSQSVLNEYYDVRFFGYTMDELNRRKEYADEEEKFDYFIEHFEKISLGDLQRGVINHNVRMKQLAEKVNSKK